MYFFSIWIQSYKRLQECAQKQQIGNFLSLTGTSKEIAEKYLVKSKWNFQDAINMFYDDGAPQPEYQKKSIPEIDKFIQQNATIEGNSKIINEEALEKLFLQILKIPEDSIVVGHLMINVMGMKKAGEATPQHIYKLFQYTKSTSLHDLASKINNLEKEVKSRSDLFASMYQGFYEFYSVTKVPTMDFDVAVQLWDFYFKHFMKFHKQFIEYLNSLQKKPNKIYKDSWKMVYEFTTSFQSVSQYNENDGWPLLIDDFIAYLKQKGIN